MSQPYAQQLLRRYLQRYAGRIEVLDADLMAGRLERRVPGSGGRHRWRDIVIETAMRESVSTRWGRADASETAA